MYTGTGKITNRKVKGLADIGIDDTTAEISLEFSDSDIADTNIYLTMSFVKTENGGWLIEWYGLEL